MERISFQWLGELTYYSFVEVKQRMKGFRIKKDFLLLIVFLTVVTFSALAQAPAPPAGGSSPCFPPSACVPIDGGISYLLASGAALVYGIYRKRKS